MTRVEHILGNAAGSEWKAKLSGLRQDVLELSQWDAQKTRLRKTTRDGEEMVVSLDRDAFLRDGDVLACDDKRAVVCRIHLCDVMVATLEPSGDPVRFMERCVRLGHALGNQHWPAVVEKGCVYVPLSVDKTVMDSVMRTHAFDGVTFTFKPGEEVLPNLTPGQARRLFGGAEQANVAHHHHDDPNDTKIDHDHDHESHRHDGHHHHHHHHHGE